MTRPQILQSKICSPSGEKNGYFPSGNPKIVPIFGGRVMTLPYSNDFQPDRNPKAFDIGRATRPTEYMLQKKLPPKRELSCLLELLGNCQQ